MDRLNGAQIVVRTLESLGVTHMFGYPGAAIIDIYDELVKSRQIRHFLARHEQGAVHMADGFARASGRVGVALVTSGPGATNTVSGVATAYGDSIPLVVISGQVDTHLIGTDAFQEVDTIGVTRPVVKHSYLCKRPQDVERYLRQAFYIASTGRKGPVLVDIPKNCQVGELLEFHSQTEVSMRSYHPTTFGHRGQIRRAVQCLAQARRPILLCGGGVVQANASQELWDLVQRFNLPVAQTLMGISAYPGTDGKNLGMVGMHGLYAANEAMHHADVVLAVAARFDDRVTNEAGKFCPHARIIHVDVDPASISKTVHADIPIVGDARAVLGQLLECAAEQNITPGGRYDAWWGEIEGWRARQRDHAAAAAAAEGPIQPGEVIACVAELLQGRDYFVTTDVGQHQMFVAQLFRFDRPRSFITSGGLGTMGFGFPAAAGAWLAHPEATVVCFTGDGSFQMNTQELATCLQYRIPVKIIILNNRSLGMVRQWQSLFYDHRYAETDLTFSPDFVKLAEAYGHRGFRIGQRSELRAVLEEALSLHGELAVVEVIIDTDAKVMPMQRRGGSMEDMILDEDEVQPPAAPAS